MSTRVEAIGAVFAAGIAVYLVYLNKASASNTGFALNMAGMPHVHARVFHLLNNLQSVSVR